MNRFSRFFFRSTILSRFITGMVFIYSGFVKGIDPPGTVYMFNDYFEAFGIEFLEPLSLFFSFLLSVAEMVIGLAILAGVQMFFASWALFLFMGFFTILTFFIALTDPVADCGCFGDAIILTNWETFWKNVISMFFVIHIFYYRKKFPPLFNNRIAEWSAVTLMILLTLGIFIHSYRNLPVIDFRPYSIGTNIPAKMEIPPDAPQDEYKTLLHYRKDGETKVFTVDSLPDSSWEWVKTENVLISEGYQPPITDFYIKTIPEDEDVTDFFLYHDGYTFMLISYDLTAASVKNQDKINELAQMAIDRGQDFICLTSSPLQQINLFRRETGAQYDFYHSDEIELKTIIRSNPGLVLMREGTILAKWHYNNIPEAKELEGDLLEFSLDKLRNRHSSAVTKGYLLALALLVSLLFIASRKLNRN